MILELTMQNWVKHHNKTFKFKEGLNIIRGENEAGKSLIFEAIDFALHGSVALRLPVSMYPTNLQSDLLFCVRGEVYFVCRTPKKASLYKGENKDNLIASGVKPVDAEIRKLLGYNRNVFMVSNYSSQDSIQYLSQMKPAERKRTIDNVVGLTAVEQVLIERKNNLSALKKVETSFASRRVEPPAELEVEYNPLFEEVIQTERETLDKLNAIIVTQQNNERQHQALDNSKPAPFELLNTDGLLSIGAHDIKHIRLKRQRLEVKTASLLKEYTEHCQSPVQRPDDVHLSALIEGLTIFQVQAGKLKRQELVNKIAFFEKEIAKFPDISGEQYVPMSEIEAVSEQEDLYKDWLEVQRLKEKGTITCNHCEGEVLLAIDHIQAHYSHVPELVEKPLITSQELINKNKDLERITQSVEDYKNQLEDFKNQLVEFDKTWYSEEALDDHIAALEREQDYTRRLEKFNEWSDEKIALNQDIVDAEHELKEFNEQNPSDDALDKAEQAMANHVQNERNKQIMDQWQKSKDALEPFDAEALQQAQTELKVVEQSLQENIKWFEAWKEYFRLDQIYSEWNNGFALASHEVEQEKLAIETLNNFKAKIKTTILPSVNAVASTWLYKMSEGKHFKITLTDDMEIMVGDKPIEALSISGRALGHLSLRMALGQVLTNSVFPVFMADEVDASMRNNRAQAVLDSLTEMLNGSMKQIIMISHRELERIDNVIEV